MRQALVGKELNDLAALLAEHGEPAYRARQIYHGLYRGRCESIYDITALPATLRGALDESFSAGLPRVAERIEAGDGTVRYLLALDDGRSIEAVFIPERGRDTLCISSQAGCAVDCKFCLTAQLGIERNLTAGEIAGQALTLCREHGLEPRERALSIVMMGMGEPLLNLANVMKAVRLMADPEGIAIPLRRITVSTSGIVPKIAEFASYEVRPKLAISLNASDQETRERVMPVAKKHRLDDLIAACKRYPLRPWERLTFEYVLLGGVNDSGADARRVVSLLGQLRAKVNLIPLNPGPGIPFDPPAPERVQAFQRIVARSLPCFVRRPRGQDIYAACGQLKRAKA